MARSNKERPAGDSFPVRQAVILAGVALAFRAVYWMLASKSLFLQTPVVDASFFDIWARTLAEGRVFQEAVFFKPPLYPYLLSWLYRVGFSLTGVLVLQMLVGTISVVLTFAIGRLAFSPRIAFGGALATALLPILPFFETQLLAETWTTALTLGALLLILRAVNGKSAAHGRVLFVAGFMLGIAALGRPNLMLLIVAIAVWMWWRGRPGSPEPVGLGTIGLLVVGFLIAVAPATFHNLKYGEFSLISANLGANLVAGNSDEADGVSAIPVGVLWDDLQLQSRQAGADSPAEASRFLTGRAMKWVAAHPGRALALVGKKALLLVGAREPRNNINPAWLATEDGVFLLARWWPAAWLLLPAALLGLMYFRRWKPGGGFLAWVLLIQALGVLPFFVNARFRMPLLPLLALFAAAGVAGLLTQWKSGQKRALAMNLVALAALFVVVNVDWFDLGAEKWLARDWFNQGLIHSRPYEARQPDPAEAEVSFRRAWELDPGEVDFPERLGALLLGKAQPLVAAAKSGVQEKNWARASAAVQAADPLLREGRELHRAAVELYPRSFRSWSNLGISENWLGDNRVSFMEIALARNDSTTARNSALAALQFYQYSVQDYQQSIEVNRDLEDSKRSINGVFRAIMALPGLDPTIVDFQKRASASVGNHSQRR